MAAASSRLSRVFSAYKEDLNTDFIFTLVVSKCPSYNGTRRISKACHTYALFFLF